MPKPETLAEYYRTYYSSQDASQPKLTFFQPLRLAKHIVDLTDFPGSASAIRILDFGGGDGALAVLIAKLLLGGEDTARSVSIDLVDYSEGDSAPVEGAVSMRRLDHLNEAGSGCYDLVLASSVMEHIPEPRQILERLFQAIGAEGSFYARTPWIAPLMTAFHPLSGMFDFTYPAHVHDLGKGFWERLVGVLELDPAKYVLGTSQPSIVETGLSEAPLRTIAAYLLKAPWIRFPEIYNLVGGWEVVFRATRPGGKRKGQERDARACPL